MLIRWYPLYSADDPSGGADEPNVGSEKPPRASELLARFGKDADAALRMAEKLAEAYNDTHTLREQRRQLRQEVADLKAKAADLEKKQPSEGTVILSADDAKRWTVYQEIGSDPAALKAAIAERDTAQQRLASLEREKVLRDVAEAAGYKPAVLGQLPGSAELAFEIRDVTADGKVSKAAFVKGADGTTQPLAEYAQAHWADFLPALQAEQVAAQGTAYVQQSSGGKAVVLNAAQQHISKTKYAVPGKA